MYAKIVFIENIPYAIIWNKEESYFITSQYFLKTQIYPVLILKYVDLRDGDIIEGELQQQKIHVGMGCESVIEGELQQEKIHVRVGWESVTYFAFKKIHKKHSCPDCGWPDNGHTKTAMKGPKENLKVPVTLETTLNDFIAFNQTPEAKDDEWFNIQARSYLAQLRMLQDEDKLNVGDTAYFKFCDHTGTVLKVHDLGGKYAYDFQITYTERIDNVDVPIHMRMYNVPTKHLLMTFKGD